MDVRPHFLQKVLQVHDLRLTGRVGDHGDALCAAGGQHGVFRGAHAGQGQQDVRAVQRLSAAQQAAADLVDLRPQGAQGGQMQVNGPGAQLAPAGVRQLRLPAAAENGPQKDDGRAHSPHQRLRNVPAGDAGGVDQQVVCRPFRLTAQVPQDLRRCLHIAQAGAVHDAALSAGQQRGGQHRQHAVLGALHRDTAVQRTAPLYPQIRHIAPPFQWFYPSYARRSLPRYSRASKVW